MRIQAIRASETLYKAGDSSFDADYRAARKDTDPNVAIQAMLTLNYLKVPNVADTVQRSAGGQHLHEACRRSATDSQACRDRIRPGRARRPAAFTPAELAVMERGEGIYKELCFACHGDDGRGTPQPGAAPGTTMAPSLAARRACRDTATT